jgi:hypothetical protein
LSEPLSLSAEHRYDPARNATVANTAFHVAAIAEYVNYRRRSDEEKNYQPRNIPDSINPPISPTERNRTEKQNPEGNTWNPATVFSLQERHRIHSMPVRRA